MPSSADTPAQPSPETKAVIGVPKPKRRPPKERKPPKSVNAKRKKREQLRAYGPPLRREWIKAQPSVVSGKGPCVNAHVVTGGAGYKADARFIVPLTDAEHHELHKTGIRTFEAKYHVDLISLAAQTEKRWEAHCLGVALDLLANRVWQSVNELP